MTSRAIADFVSHLHSLDIQVFIEGDTSQPEIALDQIRLRCNAPQGTLTPKLRQELRDRKAELVAYLLNAQNPSPLSASLSAEWEESTELQQSAESNVLSSEKSSNKSVFSPSSPPPPPPPPPPPSPPPPPPPPPPT
ncbi:MAG: hypothetical protein F6K32_21555, partial [Desertifilum sp. SIO1I2]|nr:hypothetical protein [Desertifilum sp. SIO1I2]